MWQPIPEETFEFVSIDAYEARQRHFSKMPALDNKAKIVLWTMQTDPSISNIRLTTKDDRLVILCEGDSLNPSGIALQDLTSDDKANRDKGKEKNMFGHVDSDYVWTQYERASRFDKEYKLTYPLRHYSPLEGASEAIKRKPAVSLAANEPEAKLVLVALLACISFMIMIEASQYHHDAEGLPVSKHVDFLGANDMVVVALLWFACVALLINSAQLLDARRPVKGGKFLQDDLYIQAQSKAQTTMCLFWVSMTVLGIYGLLRFAMGVSMGPDNDAFGFSSMGDVYNGESRDIGKALGMAFSYSALTAAAGTMAYRTRPTA